MVGDDSRDGGEGTSGGGGKKLEGVLERTLCGGGGSEKVENMDAGGVEKVEEEGPGSTPTSPPSRSG